MRLACRDKGCMCVEHVENPIACCPHCRIPLVAGDAPTEGVCIRPRCPRREVPALAGDWAILPRAIFIAADVPPANGWEPVDLTAAHEGVQ